MLLPVAAKALLAQVGAVGLGWLLWQLASFWAVVLPGFAVLAVISLTAVVLGMACRLPVWWWPIQAAFVPAVVWASSLELPPALFLGLLLLLLLVYPSNLKERVPLYLSNRATWDAVLALLPEDASFSFIDLGCGDGGGLVYLAERRPLGRFVGVETAPLPFLLAWLRTRYRTNCRVYLRSLWREDLSGYRVAYAFLSPAPMSRLWEKVKQEMKPGSLLISNSFEVPGENPDQELPVNDALESRLLVWRR